MGKLVAILAFAAVVAGGVCAGLNAREFGSLQPFPVAWNHSEDEQILLRLEKKKGELESDIATTKRVAGRAGAHAPLETGGATVEALQEQVVSLEEQIRLQREKIAAAKP